MEQNNFEELAHQLACPNGEQGLALGEKMNVLNGFITERSIKALEPVKGEHILEIGFGNGALSMPIIETIGSDGHFIGVEKSSVLAQQAITRFALEGLTHVTVLEGDCHLVSIENNTLNAVLAVNVIYFIDDLSKLLQKIHGWLKPGGRVVIGIRTPETLQKMAFTKFGFKMRSLDEIKNTMHDAGFINVASDYFDEGVTQFGDLALPIDTLIISSNKK